MTFTTPFLEALDGSINRHAMLSHPFYQLWNEGKLTQAILADYAQQYFAQVKAFPTYVSGVHSHCDDLTVRKMLLENLVEEEQGVDNHPELWLRFAEGLGVSREAVEQAELLPHTQASVAQMRSLSQSEDYLQGMAALYAYESQIPDVARTKRQGLKDFYGITDDRTVSFFSAHEQADVVHRQVERQVLAESCTTPEQQEKVLAAAEAGAKALWHFLDGVYEAYITPTLAA
ncbi:CADD family putative folate metabolism protein [Prochlorothrix hollandica]|uniref:TenA family transcriptional regulator n=1 Tax=Prochlorothrix hollandica PCC 9006 = CALU 1027 TaxID=317619 RepID=A0A0M2PNU5_PROHO|nr:CADD family putative folate metabolism protein [Prochlorothrix hollandica]KKI98280.1 TenA family transcriptional regulator [Prochlorothrix hollandica PCC 9006 = CALU 1027]